MNASMSKWMNRLLAGLILALLGIPADVESAPPAPKLQEYKNISANYAVGVWAGIGNGGSGSGAVVSLFPGKNAFPQTFKAGTRTLYIAYAPAKNLIPKWLLYVSPNMKVTIPDAPIISIQVLGFQKVYVNGVLAKSMY